MADRKAPYEVLERLARAAEHYERHNCVVPNHGGRDLQDEVEAYRAAIRPPETVREIVEAWRRAEGPTGQTAMLRRLEAALAREETAPEPRCSHFADGCQCVLPLRHAGKHTMDARDLW